MPSDHRFRGARLSRASRIVHPQYTLNTAPIHAHALDSRSILQYDRVVGLVQGRRLFLPSRRPTREPQYPYPPLPIRLLPLWRTPGEGFLYPSHPLFSPAYMTLSQSFIPLPGLAPT